MDIFDKLDRHPSPPEIHRFGLRTIAFAPLAALAWFGILRLSTGNWLWHLPAVILTFGLIIGLACAAFPNLARPLHVGWHALIAALDWVIVSLALILVFYLVFTPTGLLLRLAGRRPLIHRADPGRKTYWQPAEKVADLRRYHRQF
ncbi:MAG: hypothetical protein R3F07_09660 [Opitutaceae bacterium]